jgi:hypothetical protein
LYRAAQYFRELGCTSSAGKKRKAGEVEGDGEEGERTPASAKGRVVLKVCLFHTRTVKCIKHKHIHVHKIVVLNIYAYIYIYIHMDQFLVLLNISFYFRRYLFNFQHSKNLKEALEIKLIIKM